MAGHFLRLVPVPPAPLRLLAKFPAQPLDLLSRRAHTEVCFSRLRRIAATDGVAQEVERLVRHTTQPRFRLVDRQFQRGHLGGHERRTTDKKCLTGKAAAKGAERPYIESTSP